MVWESLGFVVDPLESKWDQSKLGGLHGSLGNPTRYWRYRGEWAARTLKLKLIVSSSTMRLLFVVYVISRDPCYQILLYLSMYKGKGGKIHGVRPAKKVMKIVNVKIVKCEIYMSKRFLFA